MRLFRFAQRDPQVPADRVDVLLAEADDLFESHRTREAIDLLAGADRLDPDPRLEARLVRLRHEAFARIDFGAGRPTWPPSSEDLFGRVEGVPEIALPALSEPLLRSAIVCHGGLVVRGLLDPGRIELLRSDIDRAFSAHDAFQDGAAETETAPWYSPLGGEVGRDVGLLRQWVRGGGGVLTVESPRAVRDVLDTFEDLGLVPIISEYLGERPALSVKKWTLRRVPVDSGTNWHQDGAFLGDSVRTVNVWITLTDCGVDAPGLDVVPRRVGEILPTGTEGAAFDWSIGEPVVAAVAASTPVQRLVLKAGDAVLFDDRFVHRTAAGVGMENERYAIESWFFAPSHYPAGQLPIVV